MQPEILPPDSARPANDLPQGVGSALTVYILFLIAIFTAVPSIAAVVCAYIFRDGAPEWLQTHYRYQIRTFWLMIFYLAIGGLTWIFLIGMAVTAIVPFWMGARCLVGMRALHEGRRVPRPETWLF